MKLNIKINIKLLLILIFLFVVIFFVRINRTNQCNMAVNLIDLLKVTDDILKRNNIEFWLNWGINEY